MFAKEKKRKKQSGKTEHDKCGRSLQLEQLVLLPLQPGLDPAPVRRDNRHTIVVHFRDGRLRALPVQSRRKPTTQNILDTRILKAVTLTLLAVSPRLFHLGFGAGDRRVDLAQEAERVVGVFVALLLVVV